jgi:hypothetical protein
VGFLFINNPNFFIQTKIIFTFGISNSNRHFMKKVYILLAATFLTLTIVKCKPAAEDRFKMHENAKRISDSIGKTIDDAMAEVAITPKDGTTVADTTKK